MSKVTRIAAARSCWDNDFFCAKRRSRMPGLLWHTKQLSVLLSTMACIDREVFIFEDPSLFVKDLTWAVDFRWCLTILTQYVGVGLTLKYTKFDVFGRIFFSYLICLSWPHKLELLTSLTCPCKAYPSLSSRTKAFKWPIQVLNRFDVTPSNEN